MPQSVLWKNLPRPATFASNLAGSIDGMKAQLAAEQAAYRLAEGELRILKAKLSRLPLRLFVR